MAAIEVTITGMLYDKQRRTVQNVVLIGEASLTGVGIGGGPMPPGQGGGGNGDHIWGPTDPRPTPPIQLPPGYPGQPPSSGGGGEHPAHPIYMPGAHPEHPIVIPPPPTEPPDPPSQGKPPPPEGGWGWHPDFGWGYFPGTGGAGPHKSS